MEKMIKIVYALLFFILMINSASALGISSANFGDVEQGKTYNQTVTLENSQYDFDNHFVVTIDGNIKGWTKVTPVEFDLAKGNVMQITLDLEVPQDAGLGELTGTVTAEGKKTVPTSGGGGGANVGYAVATKGNIYANVIKPGAVASVEITGAEVPATVSAGSVARFAVTAKNNGNVATSASFKLEVKKDGNVMASIPSTPVDFALGEEKTVKLFWDTQGITDGNYDVYVEAATIAKGSERTTSAAYKPVPLIIGEEKGGSNSTLIAAAGIVVLFVVLLVVVLKRRK
ncbi:MAG: hypothetical protein O8C66_01520 [Candidatus Methanoperedens sp.]|nr:hypothetical protein [Candidatus Methanoperedens sp.]MCZ7369165.1 hypothetical protein [Candidatus Methanoperedens sp.]